MWRERRKRRAFAQGNLCRVRLVKRRRRGKMNDGKKEREEKKLN
jgi:hypothetical protein